MRLAWSVIPALVGALAAPVHAKPKPPPGNVLFVQKNAIWRASLAVPEEPVKLFTLPPMRRKRITRLEASGDGSVLLIELGKNVAWVDMKADPPAPVYLPCRGRARLSPDGSRVVCANRTGKGTAVYRVRPSFGATPLPELKPSTVLVAALAGDKVLFADGNALFLTPVAHPEQRTQMAPHAPATGLSIAPDGQRAVGRYSDGNGGEALYGFRLDGEAARRKLVPGRPVAWSADSDWLAVDGENTGCALRAVGGEFKCFDKFRAGARDSDGAWRRLAKPPRAKAKRFDLFLGRIGGPRVEKPLPLLKGVSAAVLVP
jgi:hypothetical protein